LWETYIDDAHKSAVNITFIRDEVIVLRLHENQSDVRSIEMLYQREEESNQGWIRAADK
jgi:hypothetical protein